MIRRHGTCQVFEIHRTDEVNKCNEIHLCVSLWRQSPNPSDDLGIPGRRITVSSEEILKWVRKERIHREILYLTHASKNISLCLEKRVKEK